MTRGKIFALSCLTAALLASGALAESWRTYVNPRFGVTAQVPASWKMGPEAENGDGRQFTSPDQSADIIVSGMYSTLSPDEEVALRVAPSDGETITYKAAAANAIVVSGTRDDRIFYRKSLLHCDIWNSISIEYPAADKANYDALVTHVAGSLKPGRAAGGKTCR